VIVRRVVLVDLVLSHFAVQKALSAHNDEELDGRKIKVSIANSKPSGSGGIAGRATLVSESLHNIQGITDLPKFPLRWSLAVLMLVPILVLSHSLASTSITPLSLFLTVSPLRSEGVR
jgi:hypothetical protein